MNWRYGDTNPVVAKPGGDICIGDLVYLVGGKALPASRAFHDGPFLGVAVQTSKPEQTIRVATSGTFEFEMENGFCYGLGTLVTPVYSKYEVKDQVVFSCSYKPIGRVVENRGDTVLVRIKSEVFN